MPTLWVNGLVAVSDFQPYIQLSNEDHIVAQMTMAEARNFAMDILQMASRTEADAMIHRFFKDSDNSDLSGRIMVEFRDFRAGLDSQPVDHGSNGPPAP
jgi:hypothetical protein